MLPVISVDDNEMPVLQAMANFPLKPGQALWLGPLSCAYLKGDYIKAPWLLPNVAPPNNNRLPDKLVLERNEWQR